MAQLSTLGRNAHNMKATKICIIVIVLALVALCCFLGYQLKTERRYWKTQAGFNVAANLALYQAARQGDMRKVSSGLGEMIRDDLLAYKYQFGMPTETNANTLRFVVAQEIASQIDEKQPYWWLSNVTNVPEKSGTIKKE